MVDMNEIQLELLPLKESNPGSHQYKEEYMNYTDGCRGQDAEDAAYASTLLPRTTTMYEAGRRRVRVLPRVKELIREESQRIRDKGRRWKAQKAEQRRAHVEAEWMQRKNQRRLRDMSPRTRTEFLSTIYRNRLNSTRIDSEFDLLGVCGFKGPPSYRAVDYSNTETYSRKGNDVQNLIGKDGRKKSDMAVHFDREDASYSTGDVVKGRVMITLTQDVRVKDLKLQFVGSGRVCWGEQRSYIKGSAPKVQLRNNEVFIDHSMSLMKRDASSALRVDQRRGSSLMTSNEADEGIYLPAGIHNYPFEFHLPHDLPGSFDGRWGQIRYYAKAILVRPWKFDIEREKDFSVKCLIDLNDEPELARPIGALGEFSPGLMCIRSGAVTVELRIGRRGYVPGENIQFYVEVENNSRRKLQDTCVSLFQHVTYRAGKKTRKTSVSIASLHKGETLPYSTVVWNSESLLIPSAPGTSCKYYKGIQIKYTVSLLVKYSSWSDDFCLSVPIVLGTTGLRRQTINTYLAMLGYGQTPRGSPSTTRRNSNGQVVTGVRPSIRQSLVAPSVVGSVRHSSISSLQSVAKNRRISPSISTTLSRRDASTTSSASKMNGLIDDSSFSASGSKPAFNNRGQGRLTKFKRQSQSLESTDRDYEDCNAEAKKSLAVKDIDEDLVAESEEEEEEEDEEEGGAGRGERKRTKSK